jgi:hypothetical protein
MDAMRPQLAPGTFVRYKSARVGDPNARSDISGGIRSISLAHDRRQFRPPRRRRSF